MTEVSAENGADPGERFVVVALSGRHSLIKMLSNLLQLQSQRLKT
jgi:hypothetical protein